MSTKPQRPPFILSQGMRLLLETRRPRPLLRAEFFRAGRVARSGGPCMSEQDSDAWVPVDRGDVAHDRLQLDGERCDLSRLVITTDAGVGKTTALQWLEAELNGPESQQLAVLLNFNLLPRHGEDWLRHCLLPRLQRAVGNEAGQVVPDHAYRALESLRREGRLVLLLDALDQAPPDGSAAAALRALLDDPDWQRCRIIVSGRPYALQRHWDQLFEPTGGCSWRFVQLDEFDERQQRLFLGRTAGGADRFELIPTEAREILSTPRVLEYLRELPDPELTRIRSASDVYWHSMNHLLRAGMQGSLAARQIGLEPAEQPGEAVAQRSYTRARQLLAAIAFAMTSTRVARDTGEGRPVLVPNFDGVPESAFSSFQDAVYQLLSRRPGEGPRGRLERDMDGLSALNEFLEHGIFDTGIVGLDRVFWRNRTLQEFFAAYWLAQFCNDEDRRQLWEWLCVPELPASEEYYWVWRFLCEMPAEARHAPAWCRAVEPLFRPGDGTPAGTRRSSELMYRAWPALEQLAAAGEPLACQVQAAFWGEFEREILSGRRGAEAERRARQFCDSFLDIPAGSFRMGAPPEKQGMPDDLRRQWKEYLEREGDPAKRAEQHIAGWSFAPGKAGQEWKEQELRWWTEVFRTADVERISQRLYPGDETPVDPVHTIAAFRLCRWPTVNAWYRLFDPGHGVADSWYLQTYREISPDEETPAIFLSWYDAWAFCLWARWDGQSCQLPHEDQWEYAAKAGTDWAWNYWWDDDFDVGRCNADQRIRRTSRPDRAHANPWGLEDMLGNVLEWTADEYRRRYSLDGPPDSSARVLRGGSWSCFAFLARSACRVHLQPWRSDLNSGFRVARALQRKS